LSGETLADREYKDLHDEIELSLIAAERDHINQTFRGGKLTDEARRRIERELDLREAHFARRGAKP
jgi:CPA1 family monovalent cation:H+ antiporter